MNAIARRLLVAVVRKLLPEAVPESCTALALRPVDREIVDRRSINSFPTARPVQTLYAPPPAWVAAPAPPPRRRKVTITETIEREGFYD